MHPDDAVKIVSQLHAGTTSQLTRGHNPVQNDTRFYPYNQQQQQGDLYYLRCEDCAEIGQFSTNKPIRYQSLNWIVTCLRAMQSRFPGIGITVSNVPGISGDGVAFLKEHSKHTISVIDEDGGFISTLDRLEVPKMQKAVPASHQLTSGETIGETEV